ncbi:hypothetical protein ESCO_006493 [Escovopsis weberi]|uniref:Rhodopsin domain-containing protein n=1 Tax=Escovopsis weberi TaxID=150374 RepID=A0A0M8MUX6_ESCWE|nr:hypothetical protein ESCO_006493 [Escovopsis weberi]
MGISFFKIALCISYLRLLKRTDQRVYRTIVWAVITFIFLAHLGCSFSLIFACHPVDKSWHPLKKGTCLAPGPSFTGYAAVTIASDIIVAILPIPVLLKLNVPNSKKVGLIGIFLLGLFTTVCSILRYSQIGRIQYGDGNSTMLVLWGTIEFNVGNMVSSLPFLAPVFLRKAKEYRSKNSLNVTASPDHSRASSGKAEDETSRLCTRSSNCRDPETNDTSSNTNKGDQEHKDGRWTGALGDKDEERDPENERPAFAIFKSVTYSVRVDEGVSDDKHNRGKR